MCFSQGVYLSQRSCFETMIGALLNELGVDGEVPPGADSMDCTDEKLVTADPLGHFENILPVDSSCQLITNGFACY